MENVDSHRVLSVRREVDEPMEDLALPARKLTIAEYSKKYREKVKEEDRKLKLEVEQLQEKKISTENENEILKLNAARMKMEEDWRSHKVKLLADKNKKLREKYEAIHKLSTESS